MASILQYCTVLYIMETSWVSRNMNLKTTMAISPALTLTTKIGKKSTFLT